MNALHFSTDDLTGGAAKASYRLHLALKAAGVSSKMFVRNKTSTDPDVVRASLRSIWVRRARRVQLMLGRGRGAPRDDVAVFNTDLAIDVDLGGLRNGVADILYLHWITQFLNSRTIHQLYAHYACPLVWVMMDAEPVTGGCHYAFDCEGFAKQCGNCPQLSAGREDDLSRAVWLRKREWLQPLPITFVAATSWVADHIRRSSLFHSHRIERIALPIDIGVFRPCDTRSVRHALNLPLEKKIIFFGASYWDQPRKGMRYLVDALQQLAVRLQKEEAGFGMDDVLLLIAGSKSPELVKTLPFSYRHLGHIQEELVLALAYQSADVFLCPSVEDAGPMMIPEAMLCGTPVVAFNMGGAGELITPLITGYMAQLRDSADLAQGVFHVLSASDLPRMRAACRDAAVRLHDPSRVAKQHLDLYAMLKAEAST